jgi:hypothetical protein
MVSSKAIRKGFSLFFFTFTGSILLLSGIYIIKIYDINKSYYAKYHDGSPVALRKFPFPYRAGLSISNDSDNIETLDEFLEIHRFLNTKENTSMGEGIGLEIGNSFLPYEPRSEAISYFAGDTEVARNILGLIRQGSVDIMHSYGKKSDFTRRDALAMLQELHRNQSKIDVWIDHAKSIGNLGDDVTFGLGDHKETPAYHADITLASGIRFVWLGRITMITGQSTPITVNTFTSIYDSHHTFPSLINIIKEFAKNLLAVLGNKKYAMHENNELVRIKELDDGQKVYEFIRFDKYWKGVGTGATNKGFAYVISKKTLNHLMENEGYMIVYTHLGKNSDCSQFICKETQDALRQLSNDYRIGNIFVATTSRLLNYYIAHKYLNWNYELRDDEVIIRIHGINDPISGAVAPTTGMLKGITFYVPANTAKTRIFIGNNELERIQRNPPDYTGRESVTIPQELT